METKFQTSFIPKKPLTTEPGRAISNNSSSGGSSIFMIIAVVVFIASIGLAGFTFVWKNILLSSQEQYKQDLAKNEQSFNISLIEDLKKASAKLSLAKEIIKSHVAVSEIFKIVGALTIDGVRFTNLNYEGPTGNGDSGTMGKITLKGIATSYSSIAFQSDVFGQSSKLGTNKVIKNPLLSDMDLDANGNVGFTFSANIDPSLYAYETVYTETLKSEGLIPENSSNNTPTNTENNNKNLP